MSLQIYGLIPVCEQGVCWVENTEIWGINLGKSWVLHHNQVEEWGNSKEQEKHNMVNMMFLQIYVCHESHSN